MDRNYKVDKEKSYYCLKKIYVSSENNNDGETLVEIAHSSLCVFCNGGSWNAFLKEYFHLNY